MPRGMDQLRRANAFRNVKKNRIHRSYWMTSTAHNTGQVIQHGDTFHRTACRQEDEEASCITPFIIIVSM